MWGTVFFLHHKSISTFILTPREASPRERTCSYKKSSLVGREERKVPSDCVFWHIAALVRQPPLQPLVQMRERGLRKVTRLAHIHTAGGPTLHNAFELQAQHFQWLMGFLPSFLRTIDIEHCINLRYNMIWSKHILTNDCHKLANIYHLLELHILCYPCDENF